MGSLLLYDDADCIENRTGTFFILSFSFIICSSFIIKCSALPLYSASVVIHIQDGSRKLSLDFSEKGRLKPLRNKIFNNMFVLCWMYFLIYVLIRVHKEVVSKGLIDRNGSYVRIQNTTTPWILFKIILLVEFSW